MPGCQWHLLVPSHLVLASTVVHGAAGRTRRNPGRCTGVRPKYTYAGWQYGAGGAT